MIGRFLNADGYVNANGDLIGYNMYAYCSNNPVTYVDVNGEYAVSFLILVLIGVSLAVARIDNNIKTTNTALSVMNLRNNTKYPGIDGKKKTLIMSQKNL